MLFWKEGQTNVPYLKNTRGKEDRKARFQTSRCSTEIKLLPRNGCSLWRHRAVSFNLSLLSFNRQNLYLLELGPLTHIISMCSYKSHKSYPRKSRLITFLARARPICKPCSCQATTHKMMVQVTYLYLRTPHSPVWALPCWNLGVMEDSYLIRCGSS